jgi:scyllo-inositol 2-dehydrogenase (NADP+)
MSTSQHSDQPITVGVVGLGRAGWALHFNPLRELPGFKIVAVADPLPERCQEAADLTGCATFSSLDELLAGSNAQLIVVATPSFSHYADTLEVLRAGRHCLTEKPLALETAQADELVQLAREKGVRLFVHLMHVHRPEFRKLKETIESGILGDIFSVRTSWTNYARRWDWQCLKKNGGGQLNNTCPHTLSVVLPLLGSPVRSVFADLRNIKDAGDAEDHVHLVLKTESGATADILVSSAMALGGPKWIICGKSGTLVCDGKTIKLRSYDASQAAPLEVVDAAAPGRKYLRETLPWEEREIPIDTDPGESFHQSMLNVLLGKSEPLVTPENAAEVVRVTNLAHEAAAR